MRYSLTGLHLLRIMSMLWSAMRLPNAPNASQSKLLSASRRKFVFPYKSKKLVWRPTNRKRCQTYECEHFVCNIMCLRMAPARINNHIASE